MFVSLIFEVELGLVGVLSFWPAILMIRLLCLISQFPTLSIQLIWLSESVLATFTSDSVNDWKDVGVAYGFLYVTIKLQAINANSLVQFVTNDNTVIPCCRPQIVDGFMKQFQIICSHCCIVHCSYNVHKLINTANLVNILCFAKFCVHYFIVFTNLWTCVIYKQTLPVVHFSFRE